MRKETLYSHLSVTENALRIERSRMAAQLQHVSQLKSEGRDTSAARAALQSMRCELSSLARHRERLLEQLGLPLTYPSVQ